MSDRFSEEFLETNWKEWFLALQGFFYFAQGVAMVAIIMLPIFMQEVMGLTETQALSYYGTIMIPWAAKLVYGLLSDNLSFGKLGRRKPYIVIAGILGLFGWIYLPFFTEYSPAFLIVAIILSLSVALSDAVLDSLAVDITPQKRRGAMQGVGWGMRGLGMAIAGGVLGIIIDNVGWRLSYILPGSMIVLSCIVVLLFPEPKITDEEKVVMTTWKDYKRTFTNKSTWWVTLFMILSGTGITVVAVFTTFLKAETSFTIEGIGWGVTAFALGQFFGAAIIGLSGDYLPIFPVLLGTTLIYGGLIGTMFIISGASVATIFVIIAAVGAINGGYEATQMRIGMEHSVGPIAGTSYNWFMSISNLGQLTLGTYLIADIAEQIGFASGMQIATAFLILALIPGLISIRLMKKVQKEKKNNQEENN